MSDMYEMDDDADLWIVDPDGILPPFHEVCGHFHSKDDDCPQSPCGSYLCCVN